MVERNLWMEYTVNELATMSGVSVRTIHYYDQIGLLSPLRIEPNGYRVYGSAEVDLLQQILFYRELGVPLKKIKSMMNMPDYNREKELEAQLNALLQKRKQIEVLIGNVQRTIHTLRGEDDMSDNEKFEGFKQKLIDENEEIYGAEIRSRYGDDLIDTSNAKVKGMSREKWMEAQNLSEQIMEKLKKAFALGNPASELAKEVCDLHRQWLCMFWKDGTYSKQAHKELAEGYVADERFTAYYDKIGEGCTKFLRDAIAIYCEENKKC